MPRPAKPSLYQRAGTWHYRFTVAGKRHRGSTGESARGRAQAALAALWHAAHQQAGLPVAGGPAAQLDLTDLAALWLGSLDETEAARRNPRYVLRHRQAIKLATAKFLHVSSVTDLRWQDVMREHREAGTSWRTLQIATYSLRHLCRFAVKAGALSAAPELHPPLARSIAQEQAPRRALTEQERDRVLRALRLNGDARAARIWTAMAYSGLRRGELARLTLRWLDLRASVLRVPASAAKSGQEEIIPLHEEVRRAVRLEAAARKVRDRDVPVFGKSDIRKAWARALVRSKVDRHGLTVYHSARHTYGTLVAQAARGDVSAVMAAGRWKSLQIAARYVHASAERARAAVRKL